MPRITKYINAIHRKAISDRCDVFEPYGIYGNQVSYLIAIYKFPGLSQDDIAENMFVNKSTVARNLKILIDNGYATSKVDENDKRINRIYPTEKLKQFYPFIDQYLDNWNRDVLSDLTNEEQEIFEELLIKIANRALLKDEEDKNV